MSGPENLRGVDYQVSVALYLLLGILATDAEQVLSIKFDSLSEDEEDLTIFYSDGSLEHIQIKKKAEGYHWTPSELRNILLGFSIKNSPQARFRFVSDRGGNLDVVRLKRALASKPDTFSDYDLAPFIGGQLSLSLIKSLLPKICLDTQFCPSSNVADPAAPLWRDIRALITAPPFSTTDRTSTVVSLLWKATYDWSRNAATATISEIVRQFAGCGLRISKPAWLNIPSPPGSPTRSKESEALRAAIKKHKIVTILGISGTGKSSLVSVVASDLAHRQTVAWLDVTPLVTSDDLANQVAQFISWGDDPDFIRSIEGLSLSERAIKLGEALARREALIVFDGLDRGSAPVRDLIGAVLSTFADSETSLCRVVVSTTVRPDFCSQIRILAGQVALQELDGFTLQDAKAFLHHSHIELSHEESEEIWKLLGGHPLSFVLLKNLAELEGAASTWAHEVKIKTVQGSRAWLFERIFTKLPKTEGQTLLAVCIFDYPFSEKEAAAVLPDVDTRPHIALHDLISRSLIKFNNGLFSVHDAIQGMSYEILSASKRALVHELAAHWYEDEMRLERQREGGATYETIMKWGKHVERAVGRSVQTAGIRLLLERSNEELDVLWAVKRFHYPFSFSIPDPQALESSLDRLLDLGLLEFEFWEQASDKDDIALAEDEEAEAKVEAMEAAEGSLEGAGIETTTHKCDEDGESDGYADESAIRFKIKVEGLFDNEFLAFLCLSRQISGHMGYIPVFVPNQYWREQDLICQWEHCIEFQPLPPPTRAEAERHTQFLKDQFGKHGYQDRPPEVRATLLSMIEEGVPEYAVDEPDTDLIAASCPIFGHVCPGGAAQANECRLSLEDLDPPPEE